MIYRAYMRLITTVETSPRHPMSDTEPCFMTKRSGSNTRRRAISRPVRLTAEEDRKSEKGLLNAARPFPVLRRQLSVRKLTH